MDSTKRMHKTKHFAIDILDTGCVKLLTSVTFNFRYQNHTNLISMNNFNSSWCFLKNHLTMESLKLSEFKNKV